ncbi:hypothetical protein BS47DRAFT_1348683, partial [Hydnum rufescens UP504]
MTSHLPGGSQPLEEYLPLPPAFSSSAQIPKYFVYELMQFPMVMWRTVDSCMSDTLEKQWIY